MSVPTTAHNALRGRSLVLVVRDAVVELTKPTTEAPNAGQPTCEALTDLLVKKYQPEMPYNERVKLYRRVLAATAELVGSGLITRELKEGTKRITYYTYSLVADARI